MLCWVGWVQISTSGSCSDPKILNKIVFAVSTARHGDSACFLLNRPSSIIPTSYVTAPKKTYFYSGNGDFEVLDRELGVLTVWPGVVAGSARGQKVVFWTIFRLVLDNILCV